MAAPTITSLTPTGGAAGSTVTVVGTNLDSTTAVAFGATPATAFVADSATLLFAVAPAGTGTVDVTVTNADGSDTSEYTYTDGLFTVAEARAFDKAQLANETSYPAATITAKEVEIRAWLERVCGVNFIPTTHTDEYHDGGGGQYLTLDWPRITSITGASVRSGSTWTALTADELANLFVVSDAVRNEVYREGSHWPHGVANLKVTYVAGYATVPDLVKRAALWIAVTEIPTSNVPAHAESWDDGGVNVSFMQGDGFNGNWSRLPEVRKAIAMYSHKPPAVA